MHLNEKTVTFAVVHFKSPAFVLHAEVRFSITIKVFLFNMHLLILTFQLFKSFVKPRTLFELMSIADCELTGLDSMLR